MIPMALRTLKKLYGSVFSSRKHKTRQIAQLHRVRPYLELLEDRVLLSSNPVDVGPLEFRLSGTSDQWSSVNHGVYASDKTVLIGFNPQGGKFQSLLAVDHGIKIDTSQQKFTIVGGNQTDPNWLLYVPGADTGSSISHALLFGFRADYAISPAALAGTTPLTIAGTAVVTPSDESQELKVSNVGGGSTLVPSTVLLTHTTGVVPAPEAEFSGVLALNAFSSLAAKLISGLHVSMGDSGTYVVAADTRNDVSLISQTGSGIWLRVNNVDPSVGNIGSNIQFHCNSMEFNWDQTKKTFAIAGEWSVSFKDDDPTTTTPFLVDLGDQTNPGLVLEIGQGLDHLTVDRFQAALVPGTSNGQTRTHFNLAGMSIGLNGLFFLYDRPTDSIGIGGSASMSFGPVPNSPGKFENTIQVKLGNPSADQAGLFIKDGQVQSFDGEFSGNFSIGQFGLTGDVHVKYQAGTASASSFVSLSGNLSVSFANFTATVILPGQGLVYKNGDWDIAGGISFGLNGGFGIDGFGFAFNHLQVVYSTPANAQGGVDQVWSFSGGVTLTTLWKTQITLNDGTNPGLRIVNGQWDLEGIQLHVSKINFGIFAINNLLVDYEKTNGGQGYELKAAGTFTIASILQVGFTLDFVDGHPDTLGVDFQAVGEDPGIAVGDTGLFISQIGFEVQHMDNPQQLEVDGTLGVTYGDRLSFAGHTVTPFVATGSFKADRNELVLSGSFAVMAALSQGSAGQQNVDFAEASGSGSIDLNWGKHQYMASFDIKGFDGVLELQGQFNLNQFDQITAYVSASLHVPDGIPFIGGDTIAQVDGLFYWDPVDPSKSVVAAWIDIDLIFWHPRVGLEYQFYPAPGSDNFQFIDGGDIANLEQEATSHPDGYHATFHPTIGGPDNQPNQALFTFAWNNANEVGDVTITLPDGQTKVTLPKGATDPVDFTYGGVTYAVQAVNELAGARQYGWIIAPDLTQYPNDPDAAYDPIPTGQYTIDVVTAEPPSPSAQPIYTQAQAPNTKLTYTLKYAPPQITKVAVTQQPSSNTVNVQVDYKTALPNSSTIDLFYTTDPTGDSGVKFATISLTGLPKSGTIDHTLDLTGLTWGQNYYIFARINDGRDSNDMERAGTGKQSAISATSVTPYSDLLVQLNIKPAVPTDRSADTLSGWTVSWQPLDATGKPVGTPFVTYTNSFGQAGVSQGLGRTYQVTVTPYDRDGFTPLPGTGQTATPDGELVIARATGSNTKSPASVTAPFQNMVSIHGWISQDLSGNGSYELGGAGVPGELVYLDLNNSGVLAPGDPTVLTDLGGYYEFRTPLPIAITSYTVRLAPDTRFHMTSVRSDPDSTTDFSFTTGDSYTVTVNPATVQGAPAFNARDFLLTSNPFVVSGVAYVSGASGAAYQPGDAPVPNQKIWIKSQDGSFVQSTLTAADGSYSFIVPGIGQYQIYTDDQNPAQVNVPGRSQLALGGTQTVNIPVTTPDGRPLYGVVPFDNSEQEPSHLLPLAASGDFFGDGKTSFATLGVPDLQQNHGDSLPTQAYLVIYRGADSPSGIQATAFGPVTGTFDLAHNFDQLPNVFWEPGNAQNLLLLATPNLSGGMLASWYNPKDPVNDRGSTPVPAAAAGMTRLIALGSTGNNYLFLVASDSGNAWALLSYADMNAAPTVVASFNFGDFSGIRPVPENDATPTTTYDHLASRWGSLTTGDFDGDGRPDFAFTAVDSQGRQVIGYLLSREGYTQAHSISLGGWVRTDPANAQLWTNSVFAVNMGGAGSLSSLLIHRVYSLPDGSIHADVLQLSPNPAPAGPLTGRTAAAWFSYASLYPVSGFFGADQLVDLNGDGLPDLFLPKPGGQYWGGDATASVLINGGNGQFQPESVQDYGNSPNIPSFGLITASSQTTRVGLSVPDIVLIDSTNDTISRDDDSSRLTIPTLTANASSFSSSYLAEVHSPGSYGGYNFGFVSGGATGSPLEISGTAFIDANGNGVQDPGELNLANQRVTITNTAVPGAPSWTTTTDASGRWGLGVGPGGSGVPVGFSSLIGSVDYADSFTLGTGARANVAPNQYPVPAAALALEVTPAGHPMSWSPNLWSLSNDASVLSNNQSPYPGGDGAGSSSGFTQNGGRDPSQPIEFGIEYALRQDYVVQFDAVQTADWVAIASGGSRNSLAANSLVVQFRADDNSAGLAGIEISDGITATPVLDGPDGNSGNPIKTGIRVGQWNNYGVRFDQTNNTLTIYVNQVALATLDLTKFANGTYDFPYYNAAVNVGGEGSDRFWADNFQVGAPGSSLGRLVVTAGGLSPRNTAPSGSPITPASPPSPGVGPGGMGVAVGQSALIDQPDYADSFTLSSGARANLQPNQFPLPAAALALEVTPAGHPMSWSPDLWSLSNDTSVLADGQSPYPGGSGAGSAGGFTQTGLNDPSQAFDYGIEYGLRDDYMVQFDAVQTADRVDITSSSARDTGGSAPDSLSVYFRADDSVNPAKIDIFNGTHDNVVLAGPDGNSGNPVQTGTRIGQWNNYAVRFDRADNTLDIYVNQKLLTHLDLTTFAGGIYQSYSNAAISVGGRVGTDSSNPADRFWSDNFQVGPPASSIPPGGVGVAVGQSALIDRPDFADSFRLGTGARANLQPNQFPLPVAALALEITPAGRPMSWSPGQWSISNDASVLADSVSPYPGGSGAGSSSGFTQTAGAIASGIEYGLGDDYVVQVDAVQTTDRIEISSGPTRDKIFQGDSLTVFFRADDNGFGLAGVGIYDGTTETPVRDGPDGNTGSPIQTGTRVGRWNNYAVEFDRADGILSIYVNQTLLKKLNLKTFAGGLYKSYSNAAVSVGASGGDRTWMDNFQVGPPATPPAIRGVTVGASTLIKSLDYADSFSFGTGARAGVVPNQPVPASALGLEYHAPGTPAESWSSRVWSLTNDAYALDGTFLTYPGNSGAGSSAGFTQTGSGTQFGIEYGLRDDYIVQLDAVQTPDWVAIGSGLARDTIYQANSLAVLFRADDTTSGYSGLGIFDGTRETPVLDSPDGNSGNPIQTGTLVGQWNNYAVEFNRTDGTLSIYVNQKLLKKLDLTKFAGGRYASYSNAAVNVAGDGSDRTWMDNFQVGAPYVGYQPSVSPTTGYDFGVFYSSAAFGAIQGAIFHDDDGSKTWKPTDRPYAGITVYLDLNGDGKLDPNDPKTATDSGGGYRFNSLRPGNYVVRQVLPDNVTQVFTSQPASGTDVQPDQTTYAINFGNHQTAQGQDSNVDTVPDYFRLVPKGDTVEVDLDLMASTTVTGRTQVIGSYDPRQWRPVGVGDFTGTGTPDLLFQNARNGSLHYWELHNGQLVADRYLTTVPAGWHVAAVADLDHQGTADLILINSHSGAVVAWLMDGGTVIGTVHLGRLPRGWGVEGLADLTGNGTEDLLVRNQATGEVRAWLLDGTKVIGEQRVGTIAPAYHLVGTEPFSPVAPVGAYLYWQNDRTGQVVRWQWDYLQGLQQTTDDFPLGGPPHGGRYLNAALGSELLVPAHVTFLSSPRHARRNDWLEAFQVQVLDRFGNSVSGMTVSLALVPVAGWRRRDFRPGSVLRVATVNGVATFSKVAISRRGRYRLLASVGDIAGRSEPFDVG
jgi:hypothetical protein